MSLLSYSLFADGCRFSLSCPFFLVWGLTPGALLLLFRILALYVFLAFVVVKRLCILICVLFRILLALKRCLKRVLREILAMTQHLVFECFRATGSIVSLGLVIDLFQVDRDSDC